MLCLGWGYISLFLTSVSQIFKSNSQAFVQSRKKHLTEILTFPPIALLCVCLPPLMCMWWAGCSYVPPCHLVAPTGSANATVWVTLRQFAPHRLVFLSRNVISSLAASLHMGSLHPAVVFIIYCCFLVPFCSSGCT